jgi:CDP-diacylglycerol--serine O-phosphatidyltransferase
MLLVIFGVAGLMVSEFRYFSFKEIRLHHRHPFPVLLGLLAVILLTIGAPEAMLFLGVVGYALSGPVASVARLFRRRKATPDRPAAERPGVSSG